MRPNDELLDDKIESEIDVVDDDVMKAHQKSLLRIIIRARSNAWNTKDMF